MERKYVTERDVHFAIQQKWTYEEFLTKFFENEKALKTILNKLFGHKKAQNIIRTLKKNSETADKTALRRAKSSQNNSRKTAITTSSENSDTVELSTVKPVEALKRNLNELNQQLDEQTTREASLLAIRAEQYAAFLALEEQIAACRETLQKLEDALALRVSQLENSDSELATLSENIENLQNRRNSAQSQLKELEKVTIFIYESEIVVENYPHELPEADKNLLDKYSIDDRFEDLSRRQLRVLCGLIALVELLKNDEKKYECIFDSETLESAWNTMANESSAE